VHAFALLTLVAAAGPPQGLLCELLRNPAAAMISDPKPELGWIVNDDRTGAVQTGYRVLVASSRAVLDRDRGDLWDSGRRRSAQSISVEYAGKALAPRRSYWWKVRTWDRDGAASPWSEPQQFRTGPLSDEGRTFPGESRWQRLDDGGLVLEDRQRPDYHEVAPAEAKPNFIDFGQAAFGTLRFVASAPASGAKLTVRLGERRGPGDIVAPRRAPSNIGFAEQTVTLAPGEREYTLELPRHRASEPHSQVLPEHMPEVLPFRYAELAASDPAVRVTRPRQLALLYPFDDAASAFSSADERLDRVWRLCKHTLAATPFLGLYADGNRERMPYEADAHVQQLGHYAVDREYAVARYTNRFLLWNPSWPTEWQLHAVLMAWDDYMQTGDAEHLRATYPELRAKTLIALARDDGLISTRTGLVTPAVLASLHHRENVLEDVVDWPPGSGDPKYAGKAFRGLTPEGERDNFVFSPINTVVNAFHYQAVVTMERIARVVGKTADAELLRKRAALVRASIDAKLFDPARGLYRDGEGIDHHSLHANMFPLAFGLVPEARKAAVVAHVKSRGMACSVYASQYLLDGLYDAGEAEHALALMTSEGKRSWLNMLRAGATMTTEAWDETFKPNLTWNHAWATAPANVVARKLMGVEPLEPGFGFMRIRPRPAGLASAALKVPTIRGPVEVRWRGGDRPELEVTIPANTRAEVWPPWGGVIRVPAGHHRFAR
jgi:hypothetical protein